MRFLTIAGMVWSILLLREPAMAQMEAVPALSDAQIESGLAGFARLLEADIPADARWGHMGGREIGLLTMNGDGANIKGNGFLVRGKAGAKAEIWMPVFGGIVITKSGQDPADDGGLDEGSFGGNSFVISGNWKELDLAHDVKEAAILLRKQMESARKAAPSNVDDGIDSVRMSGFRESNDPRSVWRASRQSAFYWAAALKRTGHAAEALQIARIVFQDMTEQDRRGMIDQACNGLADSRWKRSLSALPEHRDWKKLRAELATLVGTFTQGWQQRDSARVLLNKLDERIKQKSEPPLKTAQPLAEADQKLLRDWFESQKKLARPVDERWSLLPRIAADEDEPDPGPAAGNSFPASKGLAAIPLLASLLADETLTTSATSQSAGYSHFYSGDSGGDPIERLQQAYKSFPKPVTRADLAWAKLEMILPQEMRSEDNTGHAEQIPTIMEWYASVKKASPAELALSYLENGDLSANVIAHVAKITEDKMPGVEDALISNAQIYGLEQFEPFVKQRAEKAGPFLKKLRVKLEGELEKYQRSGGQSQQKELDRGMKRLEKLASGKIEVRSADELLALVAKGTYDENQAGLEEQNDVQTEAMEAWKELPAALVKLAPVERVKMIAKHLPEFQSSQGALQLCWPLLNPAYARSMGADISLKLTPEERKQVLAETKQQWLKFLDGNFPDIKEDEQRESFAGSAAYFIEALATGANSSELQSRVQALEPLGARLSPLLRARALAFLEGREPTPLPNSKSVSNDEAAKLVTDLDKLPTDELRKQLDALDPAKLLAVHQFLTAMDKWPAGFLKLASQVSQIKINGVKDAASWQKWKGHAVNFDAIVELARAVAAETGDEEMRISLNSVTVLDGFTLNVHMGMGKVTGRDWASAQFMMTARFVEEKESLAAHCRRVCHGWSSAGSMQWSWLDTPTVPAQSGEVAASKKVPEFLESTVRDEGANWSKLRIELASLGKPIPAPAVFHFASASSKKLDEERKKAAPPSEE